MNPVRLIASVSSLLPPPPTPLNPPFSLSALCFNELDRFGQSDSRHCTAVGMNSMRGETHRHYVAMIRCFFCSGCSSQLSPSVSYCPVYLHNATLEPVGRVAGQVTVASGMWLRWCHSKLVLTGRRKMQLWPLHCFQSCIRRYISVFG